MTYPISCVVVLFNPAASVVALARTLAGGGYGVVAVVNAAPPSMLDELSNIEGVSVVDNGANIGLAAALNIGIRRAFDVNGSAFVALFDQDSAPDAAMPAALAAELEQAGSANTACIGPKLIDRKDEHARYSSNDAPDDRARSIPTSGTVISRAAFAAVGPMMEALFIDGIDHEWCLRAYSKGYRVLVSRRVSMLHDMGDAGLNCLGRYKPVHRSPLRHYYIVRNALYLARLSYLPLRWRLAELAKTVRRAVAYFVFSSDRFRTLRLIGHALRDGLSGRMGACPWI